MRRALLVVVALGFGSVRCGSGVTDSPFPIQTTGGVGGGGGGGSGGGSGGTNDPTLGNPCLDDEQCNDGIACTEDSCDRTLGRCRHRPRDTSCADDVFCNGIEVCDSVLGCRPGPPVACSDSSTCTIDRCVEETKSCEHFARDADGDGDPVWNCGGTDCDDDDPTIGGQRMEICVNARDDDCDGEVDEVACVRPQHDGCTTALEIDGDRDVELSLLAASESVALACVQPGGARRDVVVALTVSGDEPRDIEVVAVANDPGLALDLRGNCTARSPEWACSAAIAGPTAADGNFARVYLHGVEPGSYPLYVSGLSDETVTVSVRYFEPTPAPENETCGTAIELEPGVEVTAELAAVTRDVASVCTQKTGELLYHFELSEPHDVVLRATSADIYGTPTLSLRNADCTQADDELDCRHGQPTRLFARSLPAGSYFVAVGATGPSAVTLDFELLPPSPPEPDEGCLEPPPLASGVTIPVELDGHVNAVASPCLPGALDATYTLVLDEPSDVLLVERLSGGDSGAVSLMPLGCAAKSELSCKASTTSPVRARAFGVPAGEYAVVAESRVGSPIELTAFTRPTTPERVIPFADGCSDAATIPETGGRFSGNTTNANADFQASCDYGGVLAGGASEQMLRLELSEERRVIFDMGGTQYATILVVRKAEGCPGPELVHACAPGRGAERSFLDLTLEAGAYYVQVDGYASAEGPWNLDVYVGLP